MKRTNYHATTATQTYATRHAETPDLLTRIATALEGHATRQGQSPADWGHAGALGGVTEQLAYVLAALGDRSAVDAKSLDY